MENRPVFLRWSIDRKSLIIILLLLVSPIALHAEISDDLWKALIDQRLTLEKNDGSEVAGKLDGVTDKAVVVVKPGGKSISIAKDDVLNIRISMAPPTEQVSDDVWRALLRQNLVLEKSDGSEVKGQLDSVADDTVVIVTAKGRVVSVPKVDVQDVLVTAAAIPLAREASAPKKTAPKAPSASDGFAVSAGAGASLEYLFHPSLKYKYSGSSYETTYSSVPVDIKAFVDLTYIQVSAGYLFTTGFHSNSNVNGSTSGGSLEENYSYVTLAAYLKYPIGIGPVKLFPLLGVQCRLNLTYTGYESKDLKSTLTSQQKADLNEIWIEAGAGIDVPIGRFFLRPEVLVGFIKLPSTTDNDFLTALRNLGDTDVSMCFFTARVSLLAGFRF
ncbi:MAG: hypothetical protein ABSG38_02195 [Spirochaetia bacterium]|jgi:small nuclear ribonucleoprotein (snRNP)-like protein